jgi:hypothetical protein
MNTLGHYMTHNRFLNSNLQLKMITIQPTPSSSNIARIAHDGQSGSLFIEFRSGKTYKYEDVSPDTWNAFVEAESVGKFFASRIKEAYKGYVIDHIPSV